MTLYGQGPVYWSGTYSAALEMSPSFNSYLTVHPLWAVAAFLLWVAIFSAIILLLPELLALGLSTAVVLGHMAGAASWLAYRFDNYQACNALFLPSPKCTRTISPYTNGDSASMYYLRM